MKKYMLYGLIITLGLAQACRLDDYSEPNIVLDGQVTDKQTGENLQTRQPDGIRIRLLEEGYANVVPYDFWAKADGTFRNTRIPPARYRVIPVDGPFEPSSVDTVELDLTHNQSITFQVEPFARLADVQITADKAGKSITATYHIRQGAGARKILKSMLIVATEPILHESTTGKLSSPENALSGMSAAQIEAKTFSDKVEGLEAGKTYYARVAVLTENTLNRYNYSAIMEIDL